MGKYIIFILSSSLSSIKSIHAFNQHEVEKRPMPKPLQFLAKLPQLLRKNVKGDPIKDCTACYNEIMKAIEDCTDAEDVMKCVEEVLLGVADCVDCICDILSIIGGGDASNCDPMEIKKFLHKSYNNNNR